MLSSWLATDEIRKTTASGFPGSSCSQGCLFSCPFCMEHAGTAQKPPDFPWKREPWGPTVKENTKVTFVLLEGGNLQMQGTWFSLQLACFQYFLILNWKYIRDPCGSPAGRHQEWVPLLFWCQFTTATPENRRSSSCPTAAATTQTLLPSKDARYQINQIKILYLYQSDAILPGSAQRLCHGPLTFLEGAI